MNVALVGAWLFGAVSFFQHPAIFSPPLAAPRSPEMSIDLRVTTLFDDFVAVFGGRLPIMTATTGEHQLQVGLDGAVWTSLGRERARIYFPVYFADYLVGIPIMWRYRQFSAEGVISHISAHVGDGLPPLPGGRFHYSREFFHARLSQDITLGSAVLRYYAGGGAILRSLPRPLPSLAFLGGGIEMTGPWLLGVLRPLLAIDVQWHGDLQAVATSMEAGVWLQPWTTNIAQLRLTIGGYSGPDLRGQMMGRRLERISFGLHIRFADRPR